VENISTMQLSLFLMTSLMTTSFMMISLMACHRAVWERHYRKIVEKNPQNDENPNPFLEHFLLFSPEKEEELSVDMTNL
jgi:hypothetical protein